MDKDDEYRKRLRKAAEHLIASQEKLIRAILLKHSEGVIEAGLEIAAANQRQPLTDDEISNIVREAAKSSAIRRDGSTSHRIARAIERAHGIGVIKQ